MDEVGEGRSDQVFTGREGVSEISAEDAYIFFVNNLVAGQNKKILIGR